MAKDDNRFTIRFNSICPRQKWAKNILRSVGRCKATLIADALHALLVESEHHKKTPILPVNESNKMPAEILSDENIDNDLFDGLSAFM